MQHFDILVETLQRILREAADNSRRSAPNSLAAIPAETMNQMIPDAENRQRSASNSLAGIPAEIMNELIPELDPISLINLSQTSQQFRSIIKPRKSEFIERLLALECTKEFGGAEPFIHRRVWRPSNGMPLDLQLDGGYPSIHDAKWETQRFACVGCMKLLPHYHFDNHFIQNESFRKPMFGTPSAELRTSWRPSLRGKYWKQVQGLRRAQRKELRLVESELLEGDPVLLKYTAAFKALNLDFKRELNSRQIRGVDDFVFDRLGRRVITENARTVAKMFTEVSRRGQNRRNRRCNECQYKRALLLGPERSLEDSEISIMKRSRFVHCGSALRRYFPGYSEKYGRECPPIPSLRMPSFVHWLKFHEKWNMSMIRCPGCEVWQEVRAFRLSETLLGCGFDIQSDPAGMVDWDSTVMEPESIGETICNRCFVNKNGRDQLKQVLLKWLSHEQSQELSRVESLIKVGWHSIADALCHPAHPKFNTDPWVKLKREHRKSLLGLKPILERGYKLTLGSMTLLRSWFEILFRQGKPNEAETFAAYFSPTRHWEYQWLMNFTLLQSHWFHLTDMIREVKADPDRLVDWALEPRLGLPLHHVDERAFRQEAQ